MVLIQGCPATTTEQSELSFHFLYCRIYLRPLVPSNIVNLNEITVIAFPIDTAKLDQISLTQRAKRRVDRRMLASRNKFTLISPSIEHLTLSRNLILIIHPPNNIYNLLQTNNRLTRPANIKLANLLERALDRIELIDGLRFLESFLNCPADQINSAILRCDCPTERWDWEADVQGDC